jgi:5-deoxy-glucuronate isomerase
MQRSNEWFFPRGALAEGPWETVVDESISGWKYTGLRVADLHADGALRLAARDVERIVVPLRGAFDVDVTGPERRDSIHLDGRESVFDGPTDIVYIGARSSATVTGVGRVAIAEAPASAPFPTVYVGREKVPVELRGAGRSSREVHNFGVPGTLDADRLIVCEVITPAENWSSYPPHKHDEAIEGRESRLEEIYYFEAQAVRDSAAPEAARPFGLMRTYSSGTGKIEINAEVHTGDVALVPFGWHGPCVAPPGYDLYYLNVMAGPDPTRAWLISDDPAHAWIRNTWTGQDIDPRLPFTVKAE